jgi:hypothetical protein
MSGCSVLVCHETGLFSHVVEAKGLKLEFFPQWFDLILLETPVNEREGVVVFVNSSHVDMVQSNTH